MQPPLRLQSDSSHQSQVGGRKRRNEASLFKAPSPFCQYGRVYKEDTVGTQGFPLLPSHLRPFPLILMEPTLADDLLTKLHILAERDRAAAVLFELIRVRKDLRECGIGVLK